MGRSPKTLDIVAVLSAPDSKEIQVGDVGTVVEELGTDAVEVEFLDANGQTRCVISLSKSDLLVLNRDRMPIG